LPGLQPLAPSIGDGSRRGYQRDEHLIHDGDEKAFRRRGVGDEELVAEQITG
jgi:hypothetical protein